MIYLLLPVSALANTKPVSPAPKKVKTVPAKGGFRKTGRYLGQCVVGVNKILGRKVIRGWAGAIRPTVPPSNLKVGMVLLTREGGGHAAIIEGETGQYWSIRESNYFLNGMETVGRLLPKKSPLIRGGVGV